jgi:hypothetical protein
MEMDQIDKIYDRSHELAAYGSRPIGVRSACERASAWDRRLYSARRHVTRSIDDSDGTSLFGCRARGSRLSRACSLSCLVSSCISRRLSLEPRFDRPTENPDATEWTDRVRQSPTELIVVNRQRFDHGFDSSTELRGSLLGGPTENPEHS